jgi:cation-transporting ATPase 13A3/4/5
MLTFEFHHLPYYITGAEALPLYMETGLDYKTLIDTYEAGLSSDAEIGKRETLYGKCQILVDVKSFAVLVMEEFLNPFFVFQVFSVILWMYDDYVFYACVILGTSLTSLAISVFETRKNLKTIRTMAYYECPLNVLRGGDMQEMSSTEVVPGDVIEIPDNCKMPCDAALISGGAIMDEAMLTGESIPVLKDPLPYISSSQYDIDLDKRHTLYEGTFVIQTRNAGNSKSLGIVCRTGYMTMKGKLVRSILFPKPNKFKFYEDSLKFIAVLALMSLLGFIISLPITIEAGVAYGQLIKNFLNLVTITVPPALPVAMTVGITFALMRLKKYDIFCIAPPRINVAGKIDMVVFDKTGTLTEDGMDLLELGAVHGRELNMIKPEDATKDERTTKFVECMASCHSLTKVNGKVIGDTQDLKIFEATGWSYEEPDDDFDPVVKAIIKPPGYVSANNSFLETEGDPGLSTSVYQAPYQLGILHIFHFSSKLKRMGVVIKSINDEKLEFYMKGAPEIVSQLCRPETLPANLIKILADYTQAGYRVLACASKTLDPMPYETFRSLTIESIEDDLNFLGLIILQNRLKPETIPALRLLKKARVKAVMATGDNVLTGMSVARECGMINKKDDVYLGELMGNSISWQYFSYKNRENDEPLVANYTNEIDKPVWYERAHSDKFAIAVTGVTFGEIVKRAAENEDMKEILKTILQKGAVFARMSPDHKSLLIENLQDRGLLVAMCGDGANDCGALKAANVGISLSEAEASIAAPFTSKVPNISCVLKVLQEGRCALTTSLQCFKYMALYSMIQFTSTSFLFFFTSILGDNQYLVIDFFLILPLTIAMCYTGPYEKLSKRQPTATLISTTVLSSVIGQTAIQMLAQIAAYLLLLPQDFYETIDDPDTEDVKNNAECYENTVVFLTANFIYVAVCAVFNIGKPWKKPAYTNLYLTAIFFILLAFTIYMILIPFDWLKDQLLIKHLPYYFKGYLLAICGVYVVMAYLFERFFVNWLDTRRDTKHHKAKNMTYSIKSSVLSLNNS